MLLLLAAAVAAPSLADVVHLEEVALLPDGGVAFTSDRSGQVELWTVDAAGVARQRTTRGEAVWGLHARPGAVWGVSDRGGDERGDLWTLREDGWTRLARTRVAEEQPVVSPDGRTLACTADPDAAFTFHLHVRDLTTGEVRALTSGPVNVWDPVWTPDGAALVVVRTPDDQRGELLVVDATTGATRVVPPPVPDGIAWPAAFLPDGRLLTRATNDAGFLRPAAVDLATGAWTFQGPATWDVDHLGVSSDGSVIAAENVRGSARLVRILPDGSTTTLRETGVILDLDVAGDRIAWIEADHTHAPSLWTAALGGPASVLVPADLGGVDPATLPAVRRVTVPRAGAAIDAWVWTPSAPVAAPPPAVVLVHGGPGGQIRDELLAPAIALAQAGLVVVAPNYRGSTGYGKAFEDLNNRDWGGGDLEDLLAVVDALAAEGALDPARVGITGGSYGGYLTLRAITATPDRWRAAVAAYGMADLALDYALTKDRFGTWYETEMGTPETEPALFRDRSPIHALDRVVAPLLVLQGANDTNVPRLESDDVVRRLRALDRPVDYVVYPGEGHGFTRRRHVADAMARTVQFFLTHL